MPHDSRSVQKPRPAEVARPLGRVRKSVNKAGVDYAVVVETVHVDEPESFASLGNLGNRPANGSPPVILGQRKFLIGDCRYAGKEEVPCVQLIIREKIIYIAVQLVGAGFCRVGDKTTAGVPIL